MSLLILFPRGQRSRGMGTSEELFPCPSSQGLLGWSSHCHVLEILRFSRTPFHPHCCVFICDGNVNFKSVVVSLSGCCNKIQGKITRPKQHRFILARV